LKGAVADWTLIVTTLGTAGISGSVGYLASRKTADVAISSIEAENERLKEQHAEEGRRVRQTAYTELLNAERRFSTAVRRGEAGQDVFLDWNHAAHAVMIGGTDATGEAIKSVSKIHANIATEASKRVGDGESLQQAWGNAYEANMDELNDARDALLTAMREDVAPE
jgi:hypothetical protein